MGAAIDRAETLEVAVSENAGPLEHAAPSKHEKVALELHHRNDFALHQDTILGFAVVFRDVLRW